MENVEYLGFLIEVSSPKTGTYEYSVFDMTGKDKPEFSVFETDDVEFVSYGAAVCDAKSWIRDFLFLDDDRAVEHIEKLYATKKALSSCPSTETTGRVLPKLTAEVFNRPDCPDWAKYAVVNSRGTLMFFGEKPHFEGEDYGCWSCSGYTYKHINGAVFDASDWENSLVERPAKLPEWCKVGEWVFADPEKLFGPAGYKKIKTIDGLELTFADGCCIYFSDKIKQARLCPYNAEEMQRLVGKVLDDPDSSRLVTTYAKSNSGKILTSRGWYTADELRISDYTVDGRPCGRLEHLENGEWVE